MPETAPAEQMRTAFSVRMLPTVEARFRAACARLGVTPTDVFRDAADAFLAANDPQEGDTR